MGGEPGRLRHHATDKLQQEIDSSFITIGEKPTDMLGLYRFDNLDEGEFRISARAEGFASETANITVEGGKRIIKILALEPQQESPAAAAGMKSAVPLYHNDTPRAAASSSPSALDICSLSQGKPIRPSQIFFTPPQAVPSVIPGPSELPYLYNNKQLLTSSTGSRFVAAGQPVYLRGFAIDQDLLSPQEFNPDLPCFDIYGNKNGNFSASAFTYRWTLQDKNGADVSSLLQPSPTQVPVGLGVYVIV